MADEAKREGPDSPAKGRSGARALAAAALAAGQTAKAAAEAAGVHERTVRKWMESPEFAGEVERLRDGVIRTALGCLSASMASAAEVLTKLLKSKNAGVKLRAAKAILELAPRLNDNVKTADRVKDLEAKLLGNVG